MKKRLLAMGLSVMMALSLAACGGDAQKTQNNNKAEKPAFVYVPEYLDWETEASENSYTNIYGIMNGYVLGEVSEWNSETGIQTYTILKYHLEDETMVKVPFSTGNPSEYLSSVTLNSDNQIVVNAQISNYDEATQKSSQSFRILTLDDAGEIINEIDLSEIYAEIQKDNEYAYLSQFAVDKDGVLYAVFDEKLVAVNPDGSKLFETVLTDWANGMGLMPDGKPYVWYYGMNGTELAVIDKAAKGLGTVYKLGNYNINGFFDITEDNKLCFNDSDSVRIMDLASGEATELFSWLSMDVNGQYIDGVEYVDENTVIASYRDWDTNESGFIKAVKTDAGLVEVKETLTMASLVDNGNLQEDIIAFNKANDQYRIDLKIYLDYNTMSEADYDNYEQFLTDAQTRMLNDLTGSNPPDLICLTNSNISMETLANKGLLEDLTPYLKQAGYAESDFVEGVVNCYKLDGKLYTLPSRFVVSTMLADSAIVGEKQGWSLQEALEVIKNLPEGMSFSDYDTQEYFIQRCLMYGYRTFIDERNATCNFDSDEFKAVLEMAKMYPKEYTYSDDMPSTPIQLINGDILTIEHSISSLEEVQVALAYFGDKTPTFIGFPGVEGNGSLLSSYGVEYAVCSKSEHKDVLAEFVVDLITKPYDPEDWRSWGFPSLKTELDAYIQDQITIEYVTDENGELILDENGNPIPTTGGGGMSWGDWSYDYRPCTQEDADVFMDLISGIESTAAQFNANNTLFTMIMEEVEPFLNGQKSADDVAKVIQNRISLYLIENS